MLSPDRNLPGIGNHQEIFYKVAVLGNFSKFT